MPFVPFHEAFPDLAKRETRTITILDNHRELPAADYGLVEMYCDEPDCDCRRVFFTVLSSKTERLVAVIAYGWESLRFYARWLGFDDPRLIKELKGPSLNAGSPQSEIAPAVLDIVKNVVLQDEPYVERLKTHYALFRQGIESKGNAGSVQRRKKSGTKRLRKRRSARNK